MTLTDKPIQPASPTPNPPPVTPAAEPAKPAAEPTKPEIKVTDLSSALQVKLGHATEKKDAPAGDDAELNKQIEEATKGFEPKAKESWAQKTYELRDAKRKLAEAEAAVKAAEAYKQELEQLKAKPPVAAPSEELTKKLEEYEKEIAAVRYEKTATYQEQVAKPLAAALSAATQTGVRGEITEAQVLAAINDASPDRPKKLADVLANLTEFDKVAFVQAVRAVDSLRARSTELLSQAKTQLEQQTAAEQARAAEQAAQRKKEWESVVPTAWAELEAAVPILKPIEKADEWNAALENAKKFAVEQQFEKFDVKSQATIMQRAAVFSMLQGTISYQESQIKQLQADLAKYRAGTPGAGDLGNPNPAPVKDGDKNKSFVDAIKDRLIGAGAVTQ